MNQACAEMSFGGSARLGMSGMGTTHVRKHVHVRFQLQVLLVWGHRRGKLWVLQLRQCSKCLP
eukprot:1141533-Pelagomonas_calceolata.AAC.5